MVSVLLVEDNLADVVLLQEALEQGGWDYRITRAADGQEALDYLRRVSSGDLEPPGLIIMDLNLPRIDGGRLIELIVATPALAAIPLVVLSTAGPEGSQGIPAWYRPEWYFVKPSLFSDLVAVVRQIERYRQSRKTATR